jgi:hypothetical protein
MSKPVHLFVSSSPELQSEREAVGQIVATLPLDIGWRIDHTPAPGRSPSEGSSATCDVYALVLGQDFAAPMGAELRQAAAVGKEPMAFRRKASHSPSAQDALRRLNVQWREYTTAGEFRTLFAQALIRAVVGQATQLGLALDEVERLMKLVEGNTDETDEGGAEGRRRTEAGQSGVILGREIWETNR